MQTSRNAEACGMSFTSTAGAAWCAGVHAQLPLVSSVPLVSFRVNTISAARK
jgi:hypothetical protein